MSQKHRQFATAWISNNITYDDEPMQILVQMMTHVGGYVIHHRTCRSVGPPVYSEFAEEFNQDERDLALQYWNRVLEGAEDIREHIDNKFSDLLGYGLPF